MTKKTTSKRPAAAAEKETVPQAAVRLEGKNLENFTKVQQHLEALAPGVGLHRADVVAHALHLAGAFLHSQQPSKGGE